MWGDAVSTTGGKVAVIVAGVSLGLIGLLMAGLVVGGFVRAFGDDRDGGWWARDSQRGPMPERMDPGERGPDRMPPGQERRGGPNRGDADELPDLGLPGLGAPGTDGALRGEVIVPGDGTNTRTLVFQNGEVTAVTEETVTVRSDDGVSVKYTIGDDTRERLRDGVSTLAEGDRVMVIADKAGNETLRILKTGRSG
ncbi:hypothetical protein N802_05105 [Knoellia sinensis KCTC 19936]|uniref:DUF5666 domain-containing protein n=1 Tax=Knoellia sinensis KCTC 19936 TaxID=1385520 RepID=A0A0A0J1J7_9MICO|nr:hypothetical protein N802_05105 [Knoellia sinensis KCTC 19936]